MTAASQTVLNNMVFETTFPKLSQTGFKAILSYYGYLSRDFSLTTLASIVPDGDKLRPDGMLTALYTDYVFTNPTQVLNAHPLTIKAALKVKFNTERTTFLSKLSADEAYSLMHDESTSSNTPWNKRFFSWTYPHGANRYISMGLAQNPNSGSNLSFGETATPNVVPTWDTPTLSGTVTRLKNLPNGYKGVYLKPYALSKFDPLSGVNYYDGGGGNTEYFVSFASGAPQVSLTDANVESRTGGGSGTVNYTTPSGYPGIYFDSWTENVNKAHALFGYLKQAMAPASLDWIILDSENMVYATLAYYIKDDKFYNGYGGRTAATSMASGSKPWNQIITDPRWAQLKADYPAYPASGYIADMGNWSIYPDKNSFIFSELNIRRVCKQWNDKIFAVARYYHPNLKMSNYDFQYKAPLTIHADKAYTVWANPSGVGAIMGNRQNVHNYLTMSSVGSATGLIYQDELGGTMASRITYPPLSEYAYSNGVPHSGGFLPFVQDIRKQRNAGNASTVPVTNWLPIPLDCPYYPLLPYKSTNLNVGYRRLTGAYDYLFDELTAHSLLNCEDSFVYNTMDTAYLTTNSAGPAYPTSGNNPTALLPANFSPTGILTNGTSALAMWLNPGDFSKMAPNSSGLNLGTVAISGRVGYIGGSIGAISASGTAATVSTTFPILASGLTECRTAQPMLKCATGRLICGALDSGVFMNGFTYFMVVSAKSTMTAGTVIGGNIDQASSSFYSVPHIRFSAAGVPQVYTTNNATSVGAGGRAFDAGTSCQLMGVTFDAPMSVNKPISESAETNNISAFHMNGDYMEQTNDTANEITANALDVNSGLAVIASGSRRICIGAQLDSIGGALYTYSTQASPVYFGDIMVFNRVLTDNEMRQVQAWAYNKYQPKDGVGKDQTFYIYPTRTDRKAANERVTNMLLELESIGGAYRGNPIPWSETLLHNSVSGIVSTCDFYGNRISRVTPNPTLLSQLTVVSDASSGVHFKLGSWEVDFPRGTIANSSSTLVQPPSGYWIVQPNRTGQSQADYTQGRLQAIYDIFGITPANSLPAVNSRQAIVKFNQTTNANRGLIPLGGATTRWNTARISNLGVGELGSTVSPAIDGVTSGTGPTIARFTSPYMPSVIPAKGEHNAIHTDNRSRDRTTTGITTQTDQPSKAVPGRITYSTGSKIPKNNTYGPKTE